MAQGREGREGSTRCWGRSGSSSLGNMDPSFCPGHINALCSLERGKHLHPSTVQPHTPCSILCFFVGTRMFLLRRGEVGCAHLPPPLHSQPKPADSRCLSSPSPQPTIPHHGAGYRCPALHATAWACAQLGGALRMRMLLIWGDAFHRQPLWHCGHAAGFADLGRLA